MLTGKNKAKEWAATQFKWTKADAERAFESLAFPADETTLINAMLNFAGPEMKKRQNLQGAQRSQVTKKVAYIKQIQLKHAADIQQFQEDLKQERSQWLGFIRILYGMASKVGIKDPFIEHILETYDAA